MVQPPTSERGLLCSRCSRGFALQLAGGENLPLPPCGAVLWFKFAMLSEKRPAAEPPEDAVNASFLEVWLPEAFLLCRSEDQKLLDPEMRHDLRSARSSDGLHSVLSSGLAG